MYLRVSTRYNCHCLCELVTYFAVVLKSWENFKLPFMLVNSCVRIMKCVLKMDMITFLALQCLITSFSENHKTKIQLFFDLNIA